MTEITKNHMEWAVVDRLRQMLVKEPPHPTFNVTQAYSLFTTILCWVIERIRVPKIGTPEDEVARSVLKKLEGAQIASAPWQVHPKARIEQVGTTRVRVPPPRGFEGHTADKLLINLRHATAHGDARSVVPFNVPVGGERLLAGFTFTCENREKTWEGTITLLESDLRRIGGALAKDYCNAMRRSEAHRRDSQFGSDARSVRETAPIIPQLTGSPAETHPPSPSL